MGDRKDYYGILGITGDERKLPPEEFKKVLKKKYYTLSKEYHPDTQNGKSKEEQEKASEKFKDVNEAYETLSDDKKRNEYDNPPMSIYDMFMGRRGPIKGQSLKLRIQLSMLECQEGCHKTVLYGRSVKCGTCGGDGIDRTKEVNKCPKCNGSGMFTSRQGNMIYQSTCGMCGGRGISYTECPSCNGNGMMNVKESVTFDVPRGVEDGDYEVRSGEGCESIEGGDNGDLYLIYTVNDMEVAGNGKILKRDGKDIHTDVDVNYTELLGGCKKVVETVGGKKLEIDIKECSNPYGKVRIVGKGLPRRDGTNGNLYCSLKVVMPERLNDKARKKLEELSDELYGKNT